MFLEQMLAVAADWFSDTPRSAPEFIRDPAVAHYIAGWQCVKVDRRSLSRVCPPASNARSQ